MKLKCKRGLYSIENPMTGDVIRLDGPFEVSEEAGNAILDEYNGFLIVDDDSKEEGTEADTDDDEPTCGVNGCSRTVENPEDTCWQH